MEYVDGQFVGVRDHMASAKAAEGEMNRNGWEVTLQSKTYA
jgi:hypothetical protein